MRPGRLTPEEGWNVITFFPLSILEKRGRTKRDFAIFEKEKKGGEPPVSKCEKKKEKRKMNHVLRAPCVWEEKMGHILKARRKSMAS